MLSRKEQKKLKDECKIKPIRTVERSSHMPFPYLSLKPSQN